MLKLNQTFILTSVGHLANVFSSIYPVFFFFLSFCLSLVKNNPCCSPSSPPFYPTPTPQCPPTKGSWRVPIGSQHQQRGGRGPYQLPTGGGQPQHLPCRAAAGGARPAGLALPRAARLSVPLPWQQPAEEACRFRHLQQVHLQVCTQVSDID